MTHPATASPHASFHARSIFPSGQFGGTVLGIVIGILMGLGIALLLAVYVSKMPLPFVNRGTLDPTVGEEEKRKNEKWDPNAALQGKPSFPTLIQPKAIPKQEPKKDSTSKPAAEDAGSAAQINKQKAATDKTATDKAAAEKAAAPTNAKQNEKPAAADALDLFVKEKLTPANSTSVQKPSLSAEAGQDPFLYFVQIGAFVSAEDAGAQKAKTALLGFEASVTEREQAGRVMHRVRLGPFSTKEGADKSKAQLQANGFDGVLVRVAR